MTHFDPHSFDSMFSKLQLRMDYQDGILREIREEVKKTNGRVTVIEAARKADKTFKKNAYAACALIGGAIGFIGKLVIEFFKKA